MQKKKSMKNPLEKKRALTWRRWRGRELSDLLEMDSRTTT